MNLSEFNNLIIEDSRSARNFISFLIGYNFTTDLKDSSKAILSLYDNFSDEIKSNPKEFSPVFLKFFTKFKISNDNIQYFNQFSPLWTSDKVEYIKQLNPTFKFETTTFKNSKTFCIAARKSIESNNINFVLDNTETINNLIVKDKDNLFFNLNKENVYRTLILKNFKHLIDFNDKFEFNTNHVLNHFDNQDVINYLLLYTHNIENISNVLKYIKNNFNENNTTLFKNNDVKNNILGVILKLLDNNKLSDTDMNKIGLLVTLFDDKINDILKGKQLEINTNIDNKETWKNLINTYIEYYKYISNGQKDKNIDLMCNHLDSLLNYVSNFKLSNYLSETISPNNTVKKNKI